MRHLSFICIVACAFVVFAPQARAQSQSLSVTPPLFQLSIQPGDRWQSSVKVVNPNPYPITVGADVQNFTASGESGYGRFVPIEGDRNDKKTLAEWISITNAPQTIPAEASVDIPFVIEVPTNAPPGGHYAALLISTQPSEGAGGQTVQTVQTVTSLLFMRVAGDVREEGVIREFRAQDAVVSTPDVTLSLRFENKGNVHLQPKGDIIITNMWGTERGRIPVNEKSNFGNVLPHSIRDFTFSWSSDFAITDIGRYKALATLAYGEDGVKSDYAATYFWVIPVKGTLITLAVLGVFITLIVFMVRAYVRRVLVLAGVPVVAKGTLAASKNTDVRLTYAQAAAPLKAGVLDLRTRLTSTPSRSRFTVFLDFVRQYRLFFLSLAVLTCIITAVVWYIGKATVTERAYEVHVVE